MGRSNYYNQISCYCRVGKVNFNHYKYFYIFLKFLKKNYKKLIKSTKNLKNPPKTHNLILFFKIIHLKLLIIKIQNYSNYQKLPKWLFKLIKWPKFSAHYQNLQNIDKNDNINKYYYIPLNDKVFDEFSIKILII